MALVWIAAELRRRGKKQHHLATALKTDPSAISKIIKGERQIKGHEIPLMATFFGLTPDSLIALLSDSSPPATQPRSSRQTPVDDGTSAKIPIRSAGRGGTFQEMFLDDGPVGHTDRPPSLQGVRAAYAIYMLGDSMSPRYEPGWLLHVNPFKPARAGRDVVVEKTDKSVLIKTLGRRAGGKVTLHSVNSEFPDLHIPETEISHIHVITGSDQDGG